MNPTNRRTEMENALTRGAVHGLLAHGFRYPDEALWEMLHDRSRWEGWPEAMGEIDFATGQAIRNFQERFFTPEAKNQFSLEAAQGSFVRLFGHTVRGTCPVYDLEYGTSEIFQRAADLSDIKGFYSAFGLEIADEAHERPDHISVECEFMSVMAAKEAYAHEHGEEEGLRIVRDATARFLEAHPGRWLPSFSRRVLEADPEGFHGALGRIAGALTLAECEARQVPHGPDLLELRSTDENEETTQACATEDFGTSCPMSSNPPTEEMFKREDA